MPSERWHQEYPGSPPRKLLPTPPLPLAEHCPSCCLPQLTAKNFMDRISRNRKCKLLNRPYKVMTDVCAFRFAGHAHFAGGTTEAQRERGCRTLVSPSDSAEAQHVPGVLRARNSLSCVQLPCVTPEPAPRIPRGSNQALIYVFLGGVFQMILLLGS